MTDIIRRERRGAYYVYVGVCNGKRVSVDLLASYVDELDSRDKHDQYVKRSLETVARLPEGDLAREDT